MSSELFFTRMAELIKSNPPPASEALVLETLKAIGIVPGEKFDPSKLDPTVAKGLEQSVTVALAKLAAASKETGAPVNGWRVPPMVLGNFGSDYGARAVVALIGLGADLPKDAVYPSACVDADRSLDIHVQAESPGKDKESNWLPAPSGSFNVTLRMYRPTETPPSIMDGSWKPPAVTKVD